MLTNTLRLFAPLGIYLLFVKVLHVLFIIFFSFFGMTGPAQLADFQEWMYEYSLFVLGGTKLLVLYFFSQFSFISHKSHREEKDSWKSLYRKSLQSHPRTSIVMWPIFFVLLFSAYFWLYPISFSSVYLTNWDDLLAGYFYVSLYLFINLIVGHYLLPLSRWELFGLKAGRPGWKDFFTVGVILAAGEWLVFPVNFTIFSFLVFFYALSFMHLWRQQNLQLLFFSFISFSAFFTFFYPLQLFPALPTLLWSINWAYHPFALVLPAVLLYACYSYSLKFSQRLFH